MELLVRLRNLLGNPLSLIDRIKNFFSRSKEQPTRTPTREYPERPVEPSEPSSIVVDDVPTGLDALEFGSRNEWNAHVEKLRDVRIIRDCLDANRILINRSSELRKYRGQIEDSLQTIADFVTDERFKAPPLDEDTNEKMARLIEKLFRKTFDELFRGIYVRRHSDRVKNNPDEQKIYDALNESFERYLASVGVERIFVREGDKFAKHRTEFKTQQYDRVKTNDPAKVDRIESIEMMPHFIPYATDDGDEKLLIAGKCRVWVKP